MDDFAELAGKYISQMMEMGERFVFVQKPPVGFEDPMQVLMEEVKRCQRCSLYKSRNNSVFGEGNMSAAIMFVGEAPGRDEDLEGRPFVGAAGQLLTKMIEAMGLKRSDVYIANVLKCRPPGNREPLPEEASECKGFLLKQIELVGPKVICGLGAHATKVLLETPEPISKLRGKVHKCGAQALVPTYHPAALLRNPGWKRAAWEDLKLVMDLSKNV
jgi:DNA polymerase